MLFALCLALSGCLAQSKVQTTYLRQQAVCRDEAEVVSGGEAGAPVAAAHFSSCMNKAGWHVAVPKPAQQLPSTPVAQNPPTGILPSSPPAVSAVGPVAAQPMANQPYVTTQPAASPAFTGATPSTSPQVGPGVYPNPPLATTPSGPAYYEPVQPAPAQPYYAPPAANGSVGRNF